MFKPPVKHVTFTLEQATEKELWVVVRLDPMGQETVVSKPLDYWRANMKKKGLESDWINGKRN